MDEPTAELGAHNWPSPYDVRKAAALRATLERLLGACQQFAES